MYWTETIVKALTEDVLVACLPPLHWSDGALIDLKQIGEICRQKNILLIVDATQAVGIMPCSIKQIKPDVLACSVHKWLRGPSGASLVYVSSNWHSDWQPLDQHGRSRDLPGGSAWDASKNDMGPNGYPEKYFDDARKFDSGGKPNPILLPMLRKAMEEVVENVDLKTVQGQLQVLIEPLLEWAIANSFTLTTGKHASHLIGIRPNFLTAQQMLDICSKLQKEHNIFVAVRCGAFRISPYLDTTTGDIDKFIEILSSLIKEIQ
jgi:selenocysteine lyase/cysteine desulfurase